MSSTNVLPSTSCGPHYNFFAYQCSFENSFYLRPFEFSAFPHPSEDNPAFSSFSANVFRRKSRTDDQFIFSLPDVLTMCCYQRPSKFSADKTLREIPLPRSFRVFPRPTFFLGNPTNILSKSFWLQTYF